jgi:hypothetical protein
MKSPIAVLAIWGALAADPAWAQTQPPVLAGSQPRSPSAKDPKVFPSASSLPEPTPIEELKAQTVEFPNESIEPYLLTRESGPFMVLAKVFRGPDSEKLALALVKELRQAYKLPAYILRSKDWPGKSNIRGVPPTADPSVVQAAIGMPEKVRTYDEAAVLVGDEKTLKGSEQLLHKVKKLKPKCLDGMPALFKWREGLCRAIRTTNPMVPAQYLYPHKPDKLIVRMNASLRSIAHCPGRYSLQVAEFSGRSTFNPQDETFKGVVSLSNSPLQTAAADAERLAAKLSKDSDIQQLGQPIYVYHDRTASRVFIGSFESEKDPVAVDVRDSLLRLAVPLMDRKRPTGALDTMIVPAGLLTDLKDIKALLQ